MPHAAPVVQGEFSYVAGKFYIEVSGSKSHCRDSVSRIQELLHPTTSRPIKDEPGHWYEAQCAHYGLQPSKTKAVAKTRLLDALNNKALVVPGDISKIEDKLRRDWEKNERLAVQKANADKGSKKRNASPQRGVIPDVRVSKKKKTGADIQTGVDKFGDSGRESASKVKKTAPKIQPAKGTLRSASASGSTTPGRVNRPVETTSRIRAGSTGRGRAANPASNAPNRASVSDQGRPARARGPPTRAPRGRMVRARGGRAAAAAAAEARADVSGHNDDGSRRPRTKQTARRSRPFAVPAGGRGARAHSAADQGIGNFGVLGDEYDVMDWEPEVAKDGRNSLADDCDAPGTHEPDDLHPRMRGPRSSINGQYEVTCASLQDEWSDFADHQFTLSLAVQEGVVWGAFDFGMFEGVVRTAGLPGGTAREELRLSWRGRENGEGEISYDDARQSGWIKFLGRGRIVGALSGLYGAESGFEGVKVSGGANWSAADMKDEWEGYSQEAYEEARVRRWG